MKVRFWRDASGYVKVAAIVWILAAALSVGLGLLGRAFVDLMVAFTIMITWTDGAFVGWRRSEQDVRVNRAFNIAQEALIALYWLPHANPRYALEVDNIAGDALADIEQEIGDGP